MRPIGFSTGALCKGDFRGALAMLEQYELPCVELSALRMNEVVTLIDSLESLDLRQYSKISFHAPSKFEEHEEADLARMIFERIPAAWPIVMHPDAIFDYRLWRRFGKRLAIENMDRRKPSGRNVLELDALFTKLPDASLCFDIGHARQFDSSMTEAFLILKAFGHKLLQVHISDVNSESQHDPISYGAKLSFQQIAAMIDEQIPVIVESRVGAAGIRQELESASESLSIPKRYEDEGRLASFGALIHSFSQAVSMFQPEVTEGVALAKWQAEMTREQSIVASQDAERHWVVRTKAAQFVWGVAAAIEGRLVVAPAASFRPAAAWNLFMPEYEVINGARLLLLLPKRHRDKLIATANEWVNGLRAHVHAL